MKRWLLNVLSTIACTLRETLRFGNRDLAENVAKCYASGIIFIDGVMFMHNTRLYKIRNKVDKELVLGKTKVREVSSAFASGATRVSSRAIYV